jgi:ESCRT-I complex subunit TSG101
MSTPTIGATGAGSTPPYPVAAGPPGRPPPPNTTGVGSGGTPYPGGVGSNSTITEEDRKASLLSAVEDKVKRKLGEIFAQYQAEMDVLQNTKRELMEGERKLNGIISKLECEKVHSRLLVQNHEF